MAAILPKFGRTREFWVEAAGERGSRASVHVIDETNGAEFAANEPQRRSGDVKLRLASVLVGRDLPMALGLGPRHVYDRADPDQADRPKPKCR